MDYPNGMLAPAVIYNVDQMIAAPNGYIIFTDSGNFNIRLVSPTGVVSTLAGGFYGGNTGYQTGGYKDGFGTAAIFKSPTGLAIAPDGSIYVSDAGYIRKMSCVPCPLSYSCSTGVTVLCPPGSYCPGTPLPVPCPSGTFNLLSGQASSSACSACPANFHQPAPGQTSCLPCPASTSSTPGSFICCGPGHYNPPGTLLCLPGAAPAASCASNASCPSGACRGGFCCNAAAAQMGCRACAPGTGSCATYSPGEACASPFDCASNQCLNGCCCAASAIQTPGCTACACWANASTTAATAGACTAAPSLTTTPLACNATVSLNTTIALSRLIAFPASANVTDALPLVFLPATAPLNTFSVDVILASPSACAAYAQSASPFQCSLARAFPLPSGTYYYLATAAALGMAATPSCGA